MNYVGFMRRLLSMIVDSIILIPGYFFIFMAFYYPTAEWGQGNILVAVLVTGFVLFIALSIYFTIMWRLFGQTPGKMLFKMKIVDFNGNQISIRRAVLRSIVLVTPVIIIYLVVSVGTHLTSKNMLPLLLILISAILLFHFLLITRDKKKRALHDKIAGTCVVRTK